LLPALNTSKPGPANLVGMVGPGIRSFTTQHQTKEINAATTKLIAAQQGELTQ
jgi:hypothetical protein